MRSRARARLGEWSRQSGALERGFTLIEVMVAMGILAASLVLLLESQSQSIRASNRSKMITTATLLARAQMAALEDELYEEGFTDLGVEASGDFSDEGFPSFRWEWLVENVELPTVEEAQAAAQTEAEGGEAAATAPGAGIAANIAPGSETADAAGAMVSAQMGIIRSLLEASVRRGTFTVYWKERSSEQSFSIQTYFTDPSRMGAVLSGQAGSSGRGNR